MKNITIVFRHPPHGNASSREGLDFALLSASFEQQVTLIFIDDGVLNLLPHQQPSQIGCRDYISTFKALPLYDIEEVWVASEAMDTYNVALTDCVIDVKRVDNPMITKQLNTADEVFVY